MDVYHVKGTDDWEYEYVPEGVDGANGISAPSTSSSSPPSYSDSFKEGIEQNHVAAAEPEIAEQRKVHFNMATPVQAAASVDEPASLSRGNSSE